MSREGSGDETSGQTAFTEIIVTIRKDENGFGFELSNGILVVKVFPSSFAFENKEKKKLKQLQIESSKH